MVNNSICKTSLSKLVDRLISLGRNYLAETSPTQIITEYTLEDFPYPDLLKNFYDSIVLNPNESITNDNFKSSYFTDAFEPYVVKKTTDADVLYETCKKNNLLMTDIDKYSSGVDICHNRSESDDIFYYNMYLDTLKHPSPVVLIQVSSESNKSHFLISASREDVNSYESFLYELKSEDHLNDLEKLAILYSKFSINRGTKSCKDADEVKDSDNPFLQNIYSPASIFAGTKCGVCLDRAYAIYDACQKIGLDVTLMIGYINAGKGVTGHAWNRVKVVESNGSKSEFDIDNMWYSSFKMIEPRIGMTEKQFLTF
jgi:hypothetical protein